MPRKKTATSRKTAAPSPAGKPVSKAAFVRSYPNLSAKEIVAKAREQGITMGEPYVYNVRAYSKAKTKRRMGARRGPGIARPIATTSGAESLLKAVAAEVGLARAIEILHGERARVHAVLGM